MAACTRRRRSRINPAHILRQNPAYFIITNHGCATSPFGLGAVLFSPFLSGCFFPVKTFFPFFRSKAFPAESGSFSVKVPVLHPFRADLYNRLQYLIFKIRTNKGKNSVKMQILHTILCTIEKNPYLCIVFFMVLDLRLERCSAVVMTVVHCFKGLRYFAPSCTILRMTIPASVRPKTPVMWLSEPLICALHAFQSR